MISSRNGVQGTTNRRSARIARIAILENVSTLDMSRFKNIVTCAICLESTVGRAPYTTKCGHIFCGDCIKESIQLTKNIFLIFLICSTDTDFV